MGLYEKIKEEIVARCDVHLCEMEHFIDLHESKPVLYKLMAELRKEGKIKHTIRVKVEERSFLLFSNQEYKQIHLNHEMKLTDACLRLGFPCRRKDVDAVLLPDAEIETPELHYLEMDCGTMRGRKAEDRFAKYAVVGNPVLWICPDWQRVEYLMQRAPENSYFSTYDEVMQSGREANWLDRDGVSYQLLPPGEKVNQESEGENAQKAN